MSYSNALSAAKKFGLEGVKFDTDEAIIQAVALVIGFDHGVRFDRYFCEAIVKAYQTGEADSRLIVL